MTQPKIILGRGGEDVECDVIISRESAVSRQHFTIRFAPELQAFEVENLSKNGILVNGEFVQRLSPPVLLRSQADIAYGKNDPMRISFLLPVGSKTSVKKKEFAADRSIPVLQWVGEAILMHEELTASEIVGAIEERHPHQLKKLGPESVVAASVRHIVTQNDHLFRVVEKAPPKNGADADREEAAFTVHDDQKSRFYSLISAGEHVRGKCKCTIIGS